MLIEIEIFLKMSPIFESSAVYKLGSPSYLLGYSHQSMSVDGQLHRVDVVEVAEVDLLLDDFLLDEVDDNMLG